MIVYEGGVDVFLFGNGLVGQAIDAALRRNLSRQPRLVAYDWTDAAQRSQTRDALRAGLSANAPVHLVWSAGKAGFGSSAEQVEVELSLFREVATFAQSLSDAGHGVSVHLTSSAGGLFEGQNEVTADTVPDPQRPYGQGKLDQEAALHAAAEESGITAILYRPSSVYGYVPNCRMGLITTLIANTLQDRTTTVTGNTNTLRDYVLADDVGRFIAQQVLLGNAPADTHLLASGQAVSIATIVEKVGAALSMPPKLLYEQVQSNAADMSFARNALPSDWLSTDLDMGIAICADRVRDDLDL